MPFVTEEIFCTLQEEEESIMVSQWPEYTEEWNFKEAEEAVEEEADETAEAEASEETSEDEVDENVTEESVGEKDSEE